MESSVAVVVGEVEARHGCGGCGVKGEERMVFERVKR